MPPSTRLPSTRRHPLALISPRTLRRALQSLGGQQQRQHQRGGGVAAAAAQRRRRSGGGGAVAAARWRTRRCRAKEITKRAGSAQSCGEDTFGPSTVHLSHVVCDKRTAVSNSKIIPEKIMTLFVYGTFIFLCVVILRRLQFGSSHDGSGTAPRSCPLSWAT